MESDVAPERGIACDENPGEYRFTRFWTESGSEYLIDHLELAWYRKPNPASPFVRTTSGVYWRITTIVVGEQTSILCPPLERGDFRLITTTLVIRVQHEKDFHLELSI